MIWTTDQEATLRECGHLGAQGAAEEIYSRHGVKRSPEATAMHASRIHVSLARRLVCPECGSMVTYLNRQTGLCKRCTEFQHVEEERAFNDLLEAERRYAEDSPEIEAAKREYDMLRQRNARLCRRYGLKGKAERD
jgi:hypothetical protein